MMSNVLKNKNAINAFEQDINSQHDEWEEEQTVRGERSQEVTIEETLQVNPKMNPEDTLIQAVIPKIFMCQQTLERCLNKLMADILPMNAVLQ